MILPSFPTFAAALALAAFASTAAVGAQAVVQPLPGTTDADRLADQMRRLAVSPQDVSALVTAGELSLKLDDLSAAAALFARAEKVDPRNPRVKAGMASILVRSERPGEALRYFAQAEQMGLSPARFAADRGFAYDLIGEQERAQRDYRTALRDAPDDDETIRRYALSLAISGRRDQALAQLDPLLRKTDRGAWRARAFVLAMTGDQPGAERIATTMMPPGMAAGLQPFFQRLPALGAADRAFAVHFGEVHSTAERVADARMVPALAALAPEAGTVTQIAVVAATPVPERDKRQRQRDRKSKPGRVELAAATPVQTQPVLPPTPNYQAAQVALAQVQPLPGTPSAYAARAPRSGRSGSSQSTRIANLTAQTAPAMSSAATSANPVTPAPTSPVQPTRTPPVQLASAVAPRPSFSTAATLAAETPIRNNAIPAASIVRPGFTATPTAPAPAPVPAAGASIAPVAADPIAPPVASAVATPVPITQPTTPVAATPVPTPVVVEPVAQPAVAPTAIPTPAPIPTTAVPPRAVAATRVSEDSILARIIAGLSIPAAELDVVEPVRPAPVPATAANVVAVAEEKEARDTAAKVVADKVAAQPTVRTRRGKAPITANVTADVATEPAPRMIRDRRTGRMVAAEDTAAEPAPRMVRDRRTGKMVAAEDTAVEPTPRMIRNRRGKLVPAEDSVAAEPAPTKKLDRKALAAKKAADDKKLADAKAAAEEKKAARSSPGRIWVQVSGGANEGDLPKAWKAVQAKAPALAGKAGYSTPLRATNRVVTGPFKTDAEARAFVNTLAKQGVSGFTFTSDAGQKVTKLPPK